MNLATSLRMTVVCLSLLVLPVLAFGEDEAASTQPEATSQEAAVETGVTEPEATTPPQSVAVELDRPAVASKEDVSFSIGYSIGTDMSGRGVDIDADQLVEGIRAGLGLNEARLTPEQVSESLFSFQMQMQQRHLAAAQENLDRGLAYLAQNAEQEGVTVTESGLQYRVLSSGEGASPTIDDVVAARYRGTRVDGSEFDSSPGDEPVAFPVNRVIPGWTEALQLMKVGDKWELVIPADLGYGEGGTPDGKIGPNTALIFEIELVEIK